MSRTAKPRWSTWVNIRAHPLPRTRGAVYHRGRRSSIRERSQKVEHDPVEQRGVLHIWVVAGIGNNDLSGSGDLRRDQVGDLLDARHVLVADYRQRRGGYLRKPAGGWRLQHRRRSIGVLAREEARAHRADALACCWIDL